MPLLVVGIFVLSGLGAVAGTEGEKENFVSETISFSTPITNEKTDYVSIELTEATSSSMETGKPMLPVVTKVYTFPFGTSVDNVEVSFSDVIEQEISKPIEPAPEPQIVSAYASNKVIETEVVAYSDIDVCPEYRFSYKTGAGLKGEEHVIYLSVHLYPVQYHPKENTIYYSSDATVDVTYTLPESPVIFMDEYDFLILAPADFESALQPLVTLKNGMGIDTILTTLDDIPSVGVDEQEDIKYYIKDAIESWGITDVLLVGAGVEGEEIFPVRNAWIGSAPYEDYFPSDLYYADIYDSTMGFSTWDKDGDGKYAEYPGDMDDVDILPDVNIGRYPCNDVTEVNTIVEKIIYYKEHNKMTNKILQMGGDTFPGDPGGQLEGEHANTVVMTKLPGYTATQLWGSNGQLSKSNIGAGFRSYVDFVDFSGHGSWASWATHPPEDDSIWIPDQTTISPYTGFLYFDVDLYRLTNGVKLPVIVINSCSNNKFTDSPTCLGWKFLSKPNGGGIATYASAGIGYGSPGHETEGVMGWMEVKAFEELYDTKNLGEAWNNCITGYFNTFGPDFEMTDYKTMLEFEMFGDPTLDVEDGDDPKIKLTHRPLNIFERFIGQFPLLAKLFELIIAKII